ncbi:hypothetical protein ACFV4M_19755, partial [Kitasatospora indigofera]
MTTAAHEFTRYADIGSALADPGLVPLPAEPSPWRPSTSRPSTWSPPGANAAGSAGNTGSAGTSAGVAGHPAGAGPAASPGAGPAASPGASPAAGAMAWLRATAARFSAGETHARRRALVEADCARLDPAALRLAAAAGTGNDTRHRVVATLAAALGIAEPEAVARAVTVMAGAWFGGPDAGTGAGPDAPTEADTAVAWLMSHLLPGPAAASPGQGRTGPADGAPQGPPHEALNGAPDGMPDEMPDGQAPGGRPATTTAGPEPDEARDEALLLPAANRYRLLVQA